MASTLQNSFYSVLKKTSADYSIHASVSIDPTHPIFLGHFPQMPVVPGVCQIQIIKDILEDTLNNNLRMSDGDNIKFTGMILPDKHAQVNVEINYKIVDEQYHVEAKIFFEETIFTKFKGKFILIN